MPRKPTVRLKKDMVRSEGNGGVAYIPTWITTCSRCGPISRNWSWPSAKDVRRAHIAKHARQLP
jgi:hypothetical protein